MHAAISGIDQPSRVERMSGLTADQVDALVALVQDHGLWKTPRRRALDPRQSVLVVLLYLRHNLAQHLLAELFGCSQPTISRLITLLIPVLAEVLTPVADRIAERELRSTVRVDGFVAPIGDRHHKQGNLYFCYLCRGRRDETCDLPHLPVQQVENAVVDHYATLHIPAAVQDTIRSKINDARDQHHDHAVELCHQPTSKIARLDRQEDGFLDLVGDPEWPREKISQRLRQIRDERERLRRQLANTERPELDAEREAIEILLDLLTEPRQLYRLASRRARKVLHQAFFERLYVDSDTTRLYIADD